MITARDVIDAMAASFRQKKPEIAFETASGDEQRVCPTQIVVGQTQAAYYELIPGTLLTRPVVFNYEDYQAVHVASLGD